MAIQVIKSNFPEGKADFRAMLSSLENDFFEKGGVVKHVARGAGQHITNRGWRNLAKGDPIPEKTVSK